MKIEPFRLERWLLEQAEIDLGGGGVTKLQLKDILPDFDLSMVMKYGRTDGSDELKSLVAEWYSVEPRNILITSGTSEANLILNLTLLEAGDHYITENPKFEQTTRFAEMLGCKVNEFNLMENKAWTPDIDELKEAVTGKTKMIFLDNPNNPSGAVLSKAELKAIIDVAEDSGAYLHCDNALRGSELSGKPGATPYPEYEKGVTTGSISKLGATSPRIGWIIGNEKLIKRCWEMKDYTTLGHSGIGEYIAVELLKQRDRLIKRNLEISKRNINDLDNWIKMSAGTYWRPPDAGFTGFPGYTAEISSEKLCRGLLKEKSLLLSPGSYFGVEGHLRINTGSTSDALSEGLERLGEYLATL
ncbi:MAG: aminotransferase class I/II-fold pyridoxal phosphate-dependent enzyme [Candidatus Bathyarchaeota archaeon]|nr:aminotransferase class I/II-fold pyridoxal phosphate-dependent enzyme [Candidatus Bathyarchaeota archaeon]